MCKPRIGDGSYNLFSHDERDIESPLSLRLPKIEKNRFEIFEIKTTSAPQQYRTNLN